MFKSGWLRVRSFLHLITVGLVGGLVLESRDELPDDVGELLLGEEVLLDHRGNRPPHSGEQVVANGGAMATTAPDDILCRLVDQKLTQQNVRADQHGPRQR